MLAAGLATTTILMAGKLWVHMFVQSDQVTDVTLGLFPILAVKTVLDGVQVRHISHICMVLATIEFLPEWYDYTAVFNQSDSGHCVLRWG